MERAWWTVVIEVWAAVVGASITVASLGVTSSSKRSTESRDAVIRLTASVDSVATRLDVLHTDMKSRDAEVFSRLRQLEASVARLEGLSNSH
jgi:TolA-binding protein